MNEEWKVIKDYSNYEISNTGKVRNKITKNILKFLLNKDNYLYVDLYNDNKKNATHKRIHRLVAETFLGESNLVVNHIDGNKHNNVVNNLEWVSPEENSKLASELGLYKTKLVKIKETNKIFRSIKDCAISINSHPSDISHSISNEKKHKGLSFEYLDYKNEKSFLREYQYESVKKMKNGCILSGGVGSGKSRTSIYYYFHNNGGSFIYEYIPMIKNPQDLIIITTAKKMT